MRQARPCSSRPVAQGLLWACLLALAPACSADRKTPSTPSSAKGASADAKEDDDADSASPAKPRAAKTAKEPASAESTDTGASLPAGMCRPRQFPTASGCRDAIPVHAWYHPSGFHFYSTKAGPGCAKQSAANPACGGEVVNEAGFSYAGVPFYSLEDVAPAEGSGAVKLQRFALLNTLVHVYSAYPAEMSLLAASPAWKAEGFLMGFENASPTSIARENGDNGLVALFRWYHPANGNRYYTTKANVLCAGKTAADPSCNGDLVNEAGLKYEGIATYVYPVP